MPTIVSVGSITIVDVHDGAPGPAVVITGNRPLNFTATDGVLDSAQPDIVLTAEVFGLASAAYVWTFLGFETSPVSSGTNVQTVTMAQFGTSRAASVKCTVNGAYVSQITIVRAERSTADAGATVGAKFGEFSVTNTILNEQFASGFTGWVNRSGNGEIAAYNNPSNPYGSTDGKYVYFGNSSGDDQVWAVRTAQLFPYDPNKLYRMRVRCRQIGGSGELYIGFEGIAADGTTYVTWDGQNLWGSQHYFVASSKKLPAVDYTDPNTWTELVGFVKGSASTSDLGEFPAYTTPCRLHTNVKYFRPLVLANYNYQPGTLDLDYVIIEEGTIDPGNLNGQIDASNVTTYIANAALGNAQIGGDIWSSNHVAGSAGWRIYRSGNAEFRNITARGDIEASSLKADTAMVNRANIVNAAVDTLQIAENAITVPVSANGASSCQTAGTDFGGAPIALVVAGNGQHSYSGSGGTYIHKYLRIYRNGVLIKEIRTSMQYHPGGESLTVWNSGGTWVITDYPGAGGFYYTVSMDDGVSCGVLAIGVRR